MRRHRQDQEQVIPPAARPSRRGGRLTRPRPSCARRHGCAAGEGRSSTAAPGTAIATVAPPPRALGCGRRAATLLVATGLGFGVASWLTPTSSARTDVEGFGFLPATGWTVIQVGLPGSAESTRIVAANVPISPGDPGRGQPLALHAWPPWTIVIDATLKARGEPARDAAFPVRSLPLEPGGREAGHGAGTADPGVRAPRGRQRLQRRRQRHLRQRAHGRDVRARRRSRSRDSSSHRPTITITVRPTIYGRDPLVVSGSVTSGKKDEKVTLQFKQCGLLPAQFRDFTEVTTHEGGGWSLETGVLANGAFRALSGGDVSNEVQVQKRVDVRLEPEPPRRFAVNVVERFQFWRKQVLIQRFDRGQREVAARQEAPAREHGRRAGLGLRLVVDGRVRCGRRQGHDDQGRRCRSPRPSPATSAATAISWSQSDV